MNCILPNPQYYKFNKTRIYEEYIYLLNLFDESCMSIIYRNKIIASTHRQRLNNIHNIDTINNQQNYSFFTHHFNIIVNFMCKSQYLVTLSNDDIIYEYEIQIHQISQQINFHAHKLAQENKYHSIIRNNLKLVKQKLDNKFIENELSKHVIPDISKLILSYFQS